METERCTPYEVEWAKRVLKCGALVESDSHEPTENAKYVPLMTEDCAFYFIPCYSDCALVQRWWCDRYPPVYQARPDSERPRWAVEVVQCFSSYDRMTPDDYELVEIARADSLIDAIKATRHWMLDQELQNEGEGLWAELEILRQQQPQ